MSDQERLGPNHAPGNPDAGSVEGPETAKVFALEIDGGARSVLVDSSTRLVNDELADERHHPVWSFDHLEASYCDPTPTLPAVDLHARVHQPIKLLELFLVAGECPLGVGVGEDQVLFEAPQGEITNHRGPSRRATARRGPEEEDAEECSSGKGPDQSERMVSWLPKSG